MAKYRIQLLAPVKKKYYLKNIENIKSVSSWEKISWLAFSDLDVSFYRDDGDMIVEISKRTMQLAIDENWEMRPSKEAGKDG